MLLSYTIIDFHLFYDGAVDIQIWDPRTRSQCIVSDTQACGRSTRGSGPLEICTFLFKPHTLRLWLLKKLIFLCHSFHLWLSFKLIAKKKCNSLITRKTILYGIIISMIGSLTFILDSAFHCMQMKWFFS